MDTVIRTSHAEHGPVRDRRRKVRVAGPPAVSRRSTPTSAQVRSMFDGLVDGPA